MSYYLTNENSFLNINNAHLKVSGNVHADVMKIGAVEFAPTASNVTTTTNFTNVTTGLTTSSNLHVGGTLTMGTVEVIATTHNLENTTTNGNVTPHTVEFQNTGTSLVASGNVEVAKELTVTGDVTVDTDTLHVDSTNNRVGVGTTSPQEKLDVAGTAPYLSITDTRTSSGGTTGRDLGGVVFRTKDITDPSPETGDFLAKIQVTAQNAGSFPDGSLNFFVGDDGDLLGSPSMVIEGVTGNVGVGTTTPGQKLSIYTGSTSTAALSFDRYPTDNYRTDIYQNDYGPDFRVGYGSHTPASLLYLKRLAGGGKEIEMDGTLTGSAINGLTRNFSFFDNLGSDGAWRTAFTVGTTAIGLFSVLSYAAGTSQSNALWYYQYKSGGTSGDVVRITGSSSPNFRFVSSSRTIEHNGNGGTHFTQLRVFPFEI